MGNDRWATMDDMKLILEGTKTSDLCTAKSTTREDLSGGPVLAYQGRRIWSFGGEGHSLYLGSTGTGKSRRGIIPLLLMVMHAGESGIIVDPKSELYRKVAWLARKLGYDVRLVNFTNIFKSLRFNILEEIRVLYHTGDPGKRETALSMVDELGQALFPESQAEPFWADSARSVFKAATIAILEHARPEEVSLASIYHFMTMGDEQYLTDTYLQTFIDNLPAESAIARQMRSYCTTANDTRAGIRSTFLQGLSLFSRSDAMVEFLSGDDLHVSDLSGDKKTLIFVCIPDHTPVYDKICGILIGQLMSHYIRVADEVYHGALPIPHHFIVDEFGNVSSALCNMPHLLSAGRSRGLRVHYVLQSLSQLTAAYSGADAKTILNNTDVIISFRCNDWETTEALSKMTGERTIDYGKYQVKEPLLTPAQFQELDTGQAFVSLRGKYRFVTFLPDYEQMFDCSEWEEPSYPTRTTGNKINLFDIKKHVVKTQRKKLLESSRDVSTRTFSGTTPSSSADSLIDKVNKQFRESEEARKAEEEKKKREAEQRVAMMPTSGESTFKYEVLVVSVGGSSKPWVVKAVSTACKISVVDATKKLQSLPASLRFKTKKEAVEAEKAISDAGGIAIIQERK